ncbi:sensor histidine kinase [Planobispora siamensis]|uniref:histidine kinase n=1 Tax=Planobispora siamensis TaxID=936338 RepID=A0A8J3WL31_9ACTN|nr:HAMP domain-containing sensor histidine kinase [Planobispora siamensis]GIH93200.1 two-component sensor histidine kinase [Planobispora siamensis]
MTGERARSPVPSWPPEPSGMGSPPAPFGPLGRRMLAAFALVASVSVVLLTLAALVGADRGLTAARQADRVRVTGQVALAAGTAYAAAGNWSGADLGPATEIAAGAGARLTVLDRGGAEVVSPPGMHRGMGAGHGASEAPVVVGGQTVGRVRLSYGTPVAAGAREVAWGWIGAAALLALTAALVAGAVVTRRLTGPILRVARTARAFAAGDRSARTAMTSPGELGELGRAFDHMAGEVARAEATRRRLAADVAHELRTPLAALQAGLEELRDGLAEPVPARLAVLHDQALRLGRVVDDLAQLSAAEAAAPALRLREADPAELVRGVLRTHMPRLHAAGLSLHADLAGGLTVMIDPDRLHQAVGNLLDNAARYCRPGDAVTVTVRAGDGTAVIEVADTGPGIPAAELPHVFERLWRGRSGAGTAGSGIGLAVVRELVTAHHGTVTATSGASGGAAFTVTLPAAARRDEHAPDRPELRYR